MVTFEVDPGSRFRVDHGQVDALDEPDDMALVLQATDGRRFGPHEPGDPDRNLAEAVIAFWGTGRIIEGDEPEPETDGQVF
jgi:hypothetical protein